MCFNINVLLIGFLVLGSTLFSVDTTEQSNQIASHEDQKYLVEVDDKWKNIHSHFTSLLESSNTKIFSTTTSVNTGITSSFSDTLEVIPQKESIDTTTQEELEKFRSAFESLVNEKRSEQQEEIQAKAEQQIFIELDGLVTDETRSKIGRDFYDIFYQRWEAPPNSNNFTIVISEQPTPSLGSLVSVSVNDEQIFRYRLQPRYEIIEQVATYAVRYTYNYMQENKHQYKIY